MNVKRNTLLLLACFVWSAAGFNIFRIGFIEYKPYHNIINYLLSVVVFVVFQILQNLAFRFSCILSLNLSATEHFCNLATQSATLI